MYLSNARPKYGLRIHSKRFAYNVSSAPECGRNHPLLLLRGSKKVFEHLHVYIKSETNVDLISLGLDRPFNVLHCIIFKFVSDSIVRICRRDPE